MSAAAALIIWLYRREGSALDARTRWSWPALRIALVLLALFMLSEAVLSVERTGLPYFVVMVDDSASQQVVDQYADPKAKAAAGDAGEGRRASPRPTGWPWPRGCCSKDDGGAPPRAAEAAPGQALPRLDRRPAPGRDRQARGRRRRRSRSSRRSRPTGDQTRLGDGVRQVLTELRGVPPTAILLLTDGQTTEGETAGQGRRVRRQKGVPHLHRSAWATPSRRATWS